MAIACWKCGRQIKGEITMVYPPIYVMRLCGTRAKAYHPKCYDQAEKEAELELRNKKANDDGAEV